MSKLYSLRLRLLGYATAVIIVALVITGVGLASLFQRHAERRIGQELDVYLAQLSGGLRFDEAGALSLARHPSDPRFNRVFGGLYWQVSETAASAILRSRSLWDAELDPPATQLLPGQVNSYIEAGPAGVDVLVHEQSIIVPTAQGDVQLRISVAVDVEELRIFAAGFNQDLIPSLALLGIALLFGFGVQISAGLRPMQALSRDIAAIRDGRAKRLEGPVPREVAPLVEEVNGLLDLQESDMVRARDRAADLAHGLKTPLTALTADVDRLREKGEDELAADIEALVVRMRRHLDRELVRARQRHGRHAISVELEPALSALVHTLERTPQGRNINFYMEVPSLYSVSLDPDDLNDIFGNLLENATRFARTQIVVRAQAVGERIEVFVEDDGPGLSPEQIKRAADRGQRLDISGGGAGLGLAIVSDIVEANGGEVTFATSSLGGLKVNCVLPTGRTGG